MHAKDTAPRVSLNGAVERGEASALLGEFAALLRNIGTPPDACLDCHPNAAKFLASYQATILLPIELPAIASAFQLAARGQWRDLLALDAQLADEPLLRPFANGSRQIGWMQLQRLRPLRDERLAQRYLTAVESREAHGWHTLVYGVTLAVYSWPLRQGLMHYGQQTISGLAAWAGAPNALDEAALRATVDRTLAETGCQITSMASP